MSSPRLPTVSRKEALILDLLAGASDLYGLELVEASEGRLKRGTVYVTLSRMEDKGYVTSSQEAKAQGAIGLPRRVYRLTALGRRAREAWAMVSKKLAWENA
jgi:PadR family transcriptional regulator, regulatory protein PadR